MRQFSLFEGDLFNRLFLAIGLRNRGPGHIVGRTLILWTLTLFPTLFLAWYQGYAPNPVRSLNAFGDVAALGMALIGYPLFFLSEWIIGEKTRGTAKHFERSGVVDPEDLPELENIHEKVERARRLIWPDLICFALAYTFSAAWIYGECTNNSNTWQAVGVPGRQWPTYAGWWLAFVGVPAFNYIWLRWIWKISLWCWYLQKVSRFKLRLIASHPDMTGGLAFLSEAQKSFAIIVFTFGLGVIAPLVAYKLEIEKADLFEFSVIGPLAGFIIGAPILFVLPLLMFTKQLSRTKRRAVDAYQDRATEAAIYFEKRWLTICHGDDCDSILGGQLGAMKNMNEAYNHIKKMRVVPFDAKSFYELFGSTIGSQLPIILKLADVPEPILKAVETIKKLFGL